MAKKRSEMTPSELEEARAYRREYERIKRANMSPSEREKRCKAMRSCYYKKLERETPEQADERRRKQKEYFRNYRAQIIAGMSPEELAEYKADQAEERRQRRLERTIERIKAGIKVVKKPIGRVSDMSPEKLEAHRNKRRIYMREYRRRKAQHHE